MTVPDTGQTVKMTNNGTGLVSPIPGYAETVSAVGREYILSTEDGDKTAITFHEIIRYDPTNFKGAGIVIAVFDRNATGMLAPFNGMMITEALLLMRGELTGMFRPMVLQVQDPAKSFQFW